tara:strand:+ start:4032 stop:5591 length:1560 start_codon:yes stop_codon:yes gene_type:complete
MIEDILKGRNYKISNAFIKIITSRMPDLNSILKAFNMDHIKFKIPKEYLTLNTPQSKNYNKPQIHLRDLRVEEDIRFSGQGSTSKELFEKVRKDRLKLEIRADYKIQKPDWDGSRDNASQNGFSLKNINVEILLTLGDREILTNHNRFSLAGATPILNELGALTRNKEMWKDKNIYITNRINGMSIRSYVYTMNKLLNEDLSPQPLYLSSAEGEGFTMGKFIYFLTGNKLIHYGGSQSKLFKKAKRYDWDKAEEKALAVKFKMLLEKLVKLKIGNLVGNNKLNVESRDYTAHNTRKPGHPKSIKHDVRLLEHYMNSDLFYFKVSIMNYMEKKPNRTIITREEKVKDKDKGDWNASFPVMEMTGKIIKIDIFIKLDKMRRIGGLKYEDSSNVLSRLKDNNYFKDNNNLYGAFWYKLGVGGQSLFETTKRSKSSSVPKRNPSNRMKDYLEGKTSYSALAHRDKTDEQRDDQQQWRKKLRRKQFPQQLVFLLINNKYKLYDIQQLSNIFKLPWGNWREGEYL